jgi:hypothetical protein
MTTASQSSSTTCTRRTPPSVTSFRLDAMLAQNLRAGGFTPSSATPDRPLSLVELIPQMSLELGMMGSSMRYRPASQGSVRDDALTRDYLLSVIDSALATLGDLDQDEETRQAAPRDATSAGFEPQ